MDKTFKTVTGHRAIDAVMADPSLRLRKYSDPTEGEREVSLDEALEIVKADPSLIYLAQEG